jgi:hypothetical protein
MNSFGFPRHSLTSVLAVPIILAGSFIFTLLPADAQPRLLGETRLALGENDIDVVRVNGCQPRITRLQFRATTADANIKSVFVRFGNGTTARLPFPHALKKGQQTRWIDLPGNERCVNTIAVIGDSRFNPNLAQSRVQFWGDTAPTPQSGSTQPRLLGATKLLLIANDKDVVRVNQCQPGIKSLQLRATRASADLKRLVVRFGNGDVVRLDVQGRLGANERTRWIDLPGSERCVKSIAIEGDTRFNFRLSQTLIEFWGK